MYKDHYHCMESDCATLFRSKEGVRDHAKYISSAGSVMEVHHTDFSVSLK